MAEAQFSIALFPYTYQAPLNLPMLGGALSLLLLIKMRNAYTQGVHLPETQPKPPQTLTPSTPVKPGSNPNKSPKKNSPPVGTTPQSYDSTSSDLPPLNLVPLGKTTGKKTSEVKEEGSFSPFFNAFSPSQTPVIKAKSELTPITPPQPTPSTDVSKNLWETTPKKHDSPKSNTINKSILAGTIITAYSSLAMECLFRNGTLDRSSSLGYLQAATTVGTIFGAIYLLPKKNHFFCDPNKKV